MSCYQIDLNKLGEDGIKQELLLDHDFFSQLEQDDLLGGEVKAVVCVKEKTDGVYAFETSLQGHVDVACDRCLDPLSLPVSLTDNFEVRLGLADDYENEPIVIGERHAVFDLGWRMYETIALALPLERVHPAGKCNSEMVSAMNMYMVDEK